MDELTIDDLRGMFPERLARSLLQAAIDQERASELIINYLLGGSATLDNEGKVVILTKGQMYEIVGADEDGPDPAAVQAISHVGRGVMAEIAANADLWEEKGDMPSHLIAELREIATEGSKIFDTLDEAVDEELERTGESIPVEEQMGAADLLEHRLRRRTGRHRRDWSDDG
jgi:RecA/RadA recombinase